VISPAAHHVTNAGPLRGTRPVTGANRSGKRRVRGAVLRAKRLDLRVSEEELLELRRLAGERGISIQRMLVDDALQRRAGDRGEADQLNGVVIDALVGELMRLRGEIGRAGNVANQAVLDARRLDSDASKTMRLNEALKAVTELDKAAAEVRELATSFGWLR
jgi:hypothetical protein